jgi:hypothetical protein
VSNRTVVGDSSLTAVMLAAALALVWAAAAPHTADLAAQAYRAHLYSIQGFQLWDNNWYGGHYLPGYSLLFPPLAAALGLRLTGVLLAPIAALLFAELLRACGVRRRREAAAWFAVALAGELLIGRLTFLLGLTMLLATMLLVVRGYAWLAVVVAAATTVSSPVAGLFLVLAGTTLALHGRRRDGVLVITGAGLPLAAMSVLAPEGGIEPFLPLSFGAAALMTLWFAWIVRGESSVLRTGALLYLVALLGCFVVHSPVGSNVVRLGVLFGGPLLLATLPRLPISLFARGALLGMVVWQISGPITEASKSARTPSSAAVYAPLLHALDAWHARAGRVEVIPTATRWEVVHVSNEFALARGWETQLDRQRNKLFYAADALTAASYRVWLDRNAVRFVVLPAIPLDRWGRAEASLVRRGLPYLHVVWRNRRWTLLQVRQPTPLVAAPGTNPRLTHNTLSFNALRPGAVLVRVRYTRYWSLDAGHGCIRKAAHGLTVVIVSRPGPVAMTPRWDPDSTCA